MFKKRNTNKKSTDLGKQADQIEHVLPTEQVKNENQINPHGKKNGDKNIQDNNRLGLKNISDLQQQVQARGYVKITDDNMYDQDNKSQNENVRQLQQCFRQFKQLNRQQIQAQARLKKKLLNSESQYEMESEQINEIPQKFQNKHREENIQEQFDPFASFNNVQNISQQYKPLVRVTNQVIIQNDSGDIIEVQQDYGQISPQEENSEDYEEGYQNQIIRKTLTRQNYLRVNQNLSRAHQQSKKNKLMKELAKISHSSVQRKIARDLRVKKSKRQELQNQIKYIDSKINKRVREIEGKIETKGRLQAQFDKVRRILQLIYYFGDELQMFDEDYLTRLSQNQQYIDKIDRLRSFMRKNRQKLRQQGPNNQQCKSEDDEKCNKRKKQDKWNGYNDDEEEEQDDIIVLN